AFDVAPDRLHRLCALVVGQDLPGEHPGVEQGEDRGAKHPDDHGPLVGQHVHVTHRINSPLFVAPAAGDVFPLLPATRYSKRPEATCGPLPAVQSSLSSWSLLNTNTSDVSLPLARGASGLCNWL